MPPTLQALQAAMSLVMATCCLAQNTADPEEKPATSNYGPTYQFKYHVHDLMTMDYKTHEEIGEDGSVRGTYTVREPNGDLRVVSYTAGDSRGFQAMVRVKPTAPAEQILAEAERTSLPAAPTKNDTDAPLKIQLDSGGQVVQTNQRELRQSNPEHQSKTAARRTSPQLEGKTNTTLQAKTAEDTRGKSNETTPQSIPDKKIKGKFYNKSTAKSKNSPNQATTFLAKPNLATAYLPYPVRPVQHGPHHGHIFAPVLLHIVPSSSDSELVPPSDRTPADVFGARKGQREPNKNKLCSTDVQ